MVERKATLQLCFLLIYALLHLLIVFKSISIDIKGGIKKLKNIEEHNITNQSDHYHLLENENNKNNSPSLYFIMHVGPPKTASSTIQCSLKYLETKELLPKNIKLMEFHVRHVCYNNKTTNNNISNNLNSLTMSNCLRNWDGKRRLPRCWQQYRRYFNEQANLNHSIIVSEETLSWLARKVPDAGSEEPFLQKLFSSLLASKYKIVILISYRDYYDWIYSYFNQIYKIVIQYSLWPDEGGDVIPPIEKYIDFNIVKNIYSDKVLDFFSKVINNKNISIKIMNMNKDNDIIKEFFCYSLPTTLNLCNISKHISIPLKENIAVDYLWCDILGTEAYRRGLIHHSNINNNNNTKLSRYHVFTKIFEYQRKKGLSCNDFSQKCPNDKFYNMLFKNSSMLRNKTLANYNSNTPDGDGNLLLEKQYRERFELAKHKFCTINTTDVLLQKEWMSFFRNLNYE